MARLRLLKELTHPKPTQGWGGKPHPTGAGANSQEKNPIGIQEAGSQPLGAACRGQAIAWGSWGAGQAPRTPSSRSAASGTALRPPCAPSLASELALPRCCHVCGSDAAAGAHLPRDFRPLHLDLPHGGASRSPPRRERQRQSEWAPGPAHRGQVEGPWRGTAHSGVRSYRASTVAPELNFSVWLLGKADCLVTRFVAWLGLGRDDIPEAWNSRVLT